MNIFKGFGNNGESNNDRKQQAQFDLEWQNALTRFATITAMESLNFNLQHPETRQAAPPHEALPDIFKEWQEIDSPWDRRRVFFEVIYQIIGKHLRTWQIINLLIAIRRPLDALNLVEQATLENIEAQEVGFYYAALAETFFALTYYEQALEYAQKAHQAQPNNSYFEILLADAFSANDRCDEANAIYTKRMNSLTPPENNSISRMFSDLFARETGVVHSPIFAMTVGKSLSDPTQAEEFWQLAENEFYHSPYFRMHHAYHLTSVGKAEQGLAKLVALVQEMPWLREANLNLIQYFDSFNATLGKQIMPELEAEIRQRIKEKGWT
ncbi:MAG: tetratricopeptide repeat protein, partial [Prochloraceae cyanobacterium]